MMKLMMTCQEIGASILLPKRGTELGSSSINAWALNKSIVLASFEFAQNRFDILWLSKRSHSHGLFDPWLAWSANTKDYLGQTKDQKKKDHLQSDLDECP